VLGQLRYRPVFHRLRPPLPASQEDQYLNRPGGDQALDNKHCDLWSQPFRPNPMRHFQSAGTQQHALSTTMCLNIMITGREKLILFFGLPVPQRSPGHFLANRR